jgi:ABC-type phosphate transport system substrate-binding protein
MSQLTFKTMTLGGVAASVVLAAAFAVPAYAVSPTIPLYAGGATFPEKVYRDIMNCYGNSSGTDTETGLVAPPATCNGATGYRESIQILYVGSGSGRGLLSYSGNPTTLTTGDNASEFSRGRAPDNPPVASTSDFGPFFGTGTGAGWAPKDLATSNNPFPKVSFIGSDDPLSSNGVNGSYDNYLANKGAGGWGAAIQFPTMIGAVAAPFKPASGAGITWTEKGAKPSGGGGSSLLSLSTDTWCGIYTGAINDWNDTAIKTDNGNVYITTGTGTVGPAAPITVVYRNDGSGTTFLFANALIHQCATSAHPVPAAWQTAPGNSSGKSNNSWFINVNAAALLPGNFVGAKGSGGVKTAITTTAGSMGYVSTDFVLPVDGTGSKAANLQTYNSFFNGTTKVFKAPTAKNATPIMTATATTPELKVPSFAANCATLPEGCANNPLDWGKTAPTPLAAGAYPIGGFTFADLYTCYASATDVDALVGVTVGSLGYWRWYEGSALEQSGGTTDLVKNALTANGFSKVPGSYISAIKKLLTTNKPTKIGTPGQLNTGCAAVVGPGA